MVVASSSLSLGATDGKVRDNSCYNALMTLSQRLTKAHKFSIRRCKDYGTEYDETITADLLIALLSIQDDKCVYCAKQLDASMHLHHIQPLSKNGAHTLQNIAFTCPFCNFSNHDRPNFNLHYGAINPLVIEDMPRSGQW